MAARGSSTKSTRWGWSLPEQWASAKRRLTRLLFNALLSLAPGAVQEICETWKLRTPNEWEPIQWWSQLLSWRNQARARASVPLIPQNPPTAARLCVASVS